MVSLRKFEAIHLKRKGFRKEITIRKPYIDERECMFPIVEGIRPVREFSSRYLNVYVERFLKHLSSIYLSSFLD